MTEDFIRNDNSIDFLFRFSTDFRLTPRKRDKTFRELNQLFFVSIICFVNSCLRERLTSMGFIQTIDYLIQNSAINLVSTMPTTKRIAIKSLTVKSNQLIFKNKVIET